MSGLLLKLSLYSAIFNIAVTPFSSGVARIFGYTTILFFVASVLTPFVLTKKGTISRTNISLVFLIALTFLCSCHELIGKSFGNIIDLVLPILSFVTFYIALEQKKQKNSKITLMEIFYANYVLCFILMIFAFGPFDFKYQVVNKYEDAIFTLGLGNPNAVSLCVMFCVILLFIQICTISNVYVKVVNILLSAVLFYILYLLSSRTVLFCAIIVAIAFLIKAPKAFKAISYFVVLVPLIMIGVHLRLLDSDDITLQILGKSISTGRPEMYRKFLDEIQTFPIRALTGNLCGYGFENLHNGLLAIFASLGVFGVLLYVTFWNRQLTILRKVCVDRKQKIAFAAILAILVHASSEAMGIVGTIPYSVFVVIIMKIAKGEIETNYDRITEDRI